MSEPKQTELLGLGLSELSLLAEEFGQPQYRARQIFEALYRQRVVAAESISVLPQDFRQALADRGYSIGLPSVAKKFVSSDGTVRYLMMLADGQRVETVWMPEGDGGEAGDGSEAGLEESGSSRKWNRVHNLHLQPSGLRSGLPVLSDRAARGEAQPHGW